MIARRISLAVAVLLGAHFVLPVASAAAAECAPAPLAVLKLTKVTVSTWPYPIYTLPVIVGGKTVQMNFTPSYATAIGGALAEELGLHAHHYELWDNGVDPQLRGNTYVDVPEFRMGAAVVGKLRVLRYREVAKGTFGALGYDVLEHFDIDIDIAAGEVKLFAPSQCGGKPAGWASFDASIPIEFDKDQSPHVSAAVDGKAFPAYFDQNLDSSRVGSDEVENLFGLTTDSAGMASRPVPSGHGTLYHYSFKTLSLGRFALDRPDIDVVPDHWMVGRCYRGNFTTKLHLSCAEVFSRMVIGADDMARMRLYFAFKDKMLYVSTSSSASAPPQVSSIPATLSH